MQAGAEIQAAIVAAFDVVRVAQDASRDSGMQVVVVGPVRGVVQTYVRDAITHRAVATAAEIVVASCHNGRIMITGHDPVMGSI